MNTTKSDNLLEVKNLQAGFMIEGQLYNAVDDVSFQLKPSQVLGVVGESGCGKSVMSLSIMGLLPKGKSKVAGGEIVFSGSDIAKLSPKQMNKLRGKDIGMIFQEPMTALNPVFTIGFQLREVLMNHLPITKKEAKAKSIELLKSVGISRAEKIIDEYPHQLSGGMRQRVVIAMAIACEPKLLIADEPTTALDVTIQAQILELLRDIQQKKHMSMILVTHDLGVVAEMADEIIVMYAGQIVERGKVQQIFQTPKHPYLKLLLDSIPRLDIEKERLDSIKGIVPSLVNMPRTGCRFADRCPSAMDECRKVNPQLAHIGEDQHVRCLLYSESYPANQREVIA
jgi:peptide/nickel transport system ATP-binding protein